MHGTGPTSETVFGEKYGGAPGCTSTNRHLLIKAVNVDEVLLHRSYDMGQASRDNDWTACALPWQGLARTIPAHVTGTRHSFRNVVIVNNSSPERLAEEDH